MNTGLRWLGPILVGLGLGVLFVAGRIVAEGSFANLLFLIGLSLVIAAVVWRWTRVSAASAATRPAEKMIFLGYAATLAAVAILLLDVVGKMPPRLDAILTVAWLAILGGSIPALLFMEAAYVRMPIPESIEVRRIRDGGLLGAILGATLIFVFSVNYVAAERDVRKDLSYFKTTRPSETTMNIVRSLAEPVRVVMLFPAGNEVNELLKPYFSDLKRLSRKFSYETTDIAVVPELARKFGGRDNGTLLVIRGEGDAAQGESILVGTDLESARNTLRSFDQRFQRALGKVLKPAYSVHFTSGHRERTSTGFMIPEPFRSDRLFELLNQFNVEKKDLGLAEGLGAHIDRDTPAVAIIGPQDPFTQGEIDSLLEYVRGGGRLLVLVDPHVDHGLGPLFKGLGVQMLDGIVSSTRNFYRLRRDASDHGVVISQQYSSHPIVTQASRYPGNSVATVFLLGGALKPDPERESLRPEPTVDFPLSSEDDFWRDVNGDFVRQDNEPIESLNLIAAIDVREKREDRPGRVIIIPDGDFVSNQVIKNPGNLLVLADSLRWLLDEEQLVGAAETEEDVPIQHTRDEDKLWFYATTFGAPIPVLLTGISIATRRRRKSESASTRETKKPEADAKPEPPQPALSADKPEDSNETGGQV